MKLIERRVSPADSPLALATAMIIAVAAAMLVTSLLFTLYGANPLRHTSRCSMNRSPLGEDLVTPWCAPRLSR